MQCVLVPFQRPRFTTRCRCHAKPRAVGRRQMTKKTENTNTNTWTKLDGSPNLLDGFRIGGQPQDNNKDVQRATSVAKHPPRVRSRWGVASTCTHSCHISVQVSFILRPPHSVVGRLDQADPPCSKGLRRPSRLKQSKGGSAGCRARRWGSSGRRLGAAVGLGSVP